MSVPTSVFEVSKDRVLELAHSIIQLMPCEWEGCSMTLNSWQTLAKHLQKHCNRASPQDGIYHCLYSRCSGRLHSSLSALRSHVELSHLSRVSLLCPVRGCEEVFIRTPQLEGHFEHAHRDLLGRHVSPDVLSPMAILAPPHPLRRPPALPNSKSNTYTVTASIAKAPRRRQNQLNGIERISRKWSRLDVQDEDADEKPVAFDDQVPFNILPDTPQSMECFDSRIEVRPQLRPISKQSILSRPQPVVHPPVRDGVVEETMGYSTFVRKVDKLVEDGVLRWEE
ncbi:hypothetical protein HYDPIDRAFT_131134 [Hydnomerulius pinastri MD-312]|nr:hypothetical protein HYDPIDRAFT_131134 [Hydnomerulius pinastri MD-312]